MANVVVVGSQWGDEGKGKIVDWLSERADVVVRFQGGHNAGHTLVIDGVSYKLSLLPSGVVRPGKLSVIGNGVVFDPHAFVAETDLLVDMPSPRVEVIDLQADPVQPNCQSVLHDQAGGGGAQSAAAAGTADQDSEVARSISLIPVVEYGLAD